MYDWKEKKFWQKELYGFLCVAKKHFPLTHCKTDELMFNCIRVETRGLAKYNRLNRILSYHVFVMLNLNLLNHL